MVFTVIEPATGLSPHDRRRARRAGPPAVAVRSGHPSMLASAGFVDIDAEDRTAEYRATQQAWLDATERHADRVRRAIGDELFDERLADRGASLAAIDAGLLRRTIYGASSPRR